MNTSKSIKKNILSLGIVQVANLLFPLITLPLIARVIGPEKFGVINYASSVIAYFVLIINYGFDLTATREVAQNKDNKEMINAIFSNVFYAKLILALVSLIAFIPLLFYFPTLKDDKLVAIYTFLICFAWVLTPNWLYQGLQDLTKIALFNLFTKVFFTIAIVLVIRKAEDYIWQPLIVSGSQLLVSVFSFYWAFKWYGIKLTSFNFQAVKKTLYEGRMIFLSFVTINLYSTTNIVILGLYQSVIQVGYYTAALKLISVIRAIFFQPVNQSLFPFIGDAFGKNRDEGIEMIRKLMPVSMIFSFLFCLVTFFLSSLMIKVIFGAAYQEAVLLFKILAFVPFIINCSYFLGIQTMINLKMDKQFLFVTCVGAIIGFPLNFILVKYYGSIGCAVSWLTTELLILIMFQVLLMQRDIHILSKKYFDFSYIKKIVIQIIQRKKIFTA